MPGSSFPNLNLLIATAFYGFILFCINSTHTLSSNMLKSTIITILGLSGLASIYLGDHWLSDILATYFAGMIICFIHCLIYRKSTLHLDYSSNSLFLNLPLLIAIFLSAFLLTYFNFQTLSYNYTPYYKEFSLHATTWWQQERPLLPSYQLSRIGKRISLLNIQFVGDLEFFQNTLEQNGWKSHLDSFFINLLKRISTQSQGVKLPLFTQLYENKSPVLIMTYTDKQSKLTLELRIWESNYNLIESNKPIWIGSIHSSAPINVKKNNPNYLLINPLNYMFPNKKPFSIKQIKLPESMVKSTLYPTQPYIILIKNKAPKGK
jgi:hypothetical protein